jgi:hypothetical protein
LRLKQFFALPEADLKRRGASPAFRVLQVRFNLTSGAPAHRLSGDLDGGGDEAMTKERLSKLAYLQGQRVSVALRDGDRIDDCQLVSVPFSGAGTVWLFSNGMDRFVPAAALVDVWECAPRSPVRPPDIGVD